MSHPSPEPCRNHSCGLTDVGRRRTENQDQFLVAELRKSMVVRTTSLPIEKNTTLFGRVRGELLIVADGMGGQAAGQRASSVALDHLIAQLLNRMHCFFHLSDGRDDAFVAALKDLLQQTHARILAEAATNDAERGMGTTLTMAYIVWPRMYVVHVGDSRCYLIRKGRCEQLTTDHTLARKLVDAGGMRPEDEAHSRWTNVLWNVLGGKGEHELVAEVRRTELVEGDTVLLCSDGLSRYLSTETLAEVVLEGGDEIQSICHRLVGLANAAGGEDNITVIVSQPRSRKPYDDELPSGETCSSQTESPPADQRSTVKEFADEDTLPGT
ncbi:PP2C family protein-serine/threonine phosphatase [Allorhodopirellula heiligendammensis]|uniref:PP2C-family Ser/Thr phosphatase n=1 Tax=Allorhodopirellula heiligendammensis TaxID=2714739 RepID=A0A5C6BSN2_9BACT|nr:protein phosphatase 2C domain-containing protein [Allorhodopirellula heiligendammensis]TWU15253.1 PP2C-family Ser/Thr phosphatase [Allorhodopirellula heiligendammensis]